MSPPKSPPTRVEGMVKGRTCGAPPAARHLLSGCRGIGTRLCRGARTRSRRAQSEQSAETQSQSPQRRSLLFTRLDDTTPCKHRITTQHKTKCVSCSHYHTFSPSNRSCHGCGLRASAIRRGRRVLGRTQSSKWLSIVRQPSPSRQTSASATPPPAWRRANSRRPAKTKVDEEK